MKHMGFPVICGAMFLFALSTPVVAENGGRGTGYAATGPTFDLPAGISVEGLEVHVALDSVRLIYIFKSSTQQLVHFDFAMPEMPVDASPDAIGVAEGDEAAGLVADAQPANYLNLSVRVNDAPLVLAGHGRALLDGKDVTRQLLDAGVPLLYDLIGEAPWLHLSPEAQALLDADGLLDLDAAMWGYQASFEWDQSFEPGETRLEVSYVPVSDYWGDIDLDAFPEMGTDGPAIKAYCIDDALRRAFLSGEHYYELYTVTHIAAASHGWHGPVGHYRLVVDKKHATDLVAFCPLAARKISPTRFEWTATDYTPGNDTGVLFFADTDAEPSNGQE